MSALSEIKDFIEKISIAIGHSLDIESVIVGTDLKRIAGTVNHNFMISNDGVIRKIIETGQYYIVDHPGEDINCSNCSQRQACGEKAFIHCPITMDGKVIGVMGLICFNDIQRENLIRKKDSLLSFIESMCELITSKLKEHELYKRAERQNLMLNQIINSFSDGYIILNNENIITNINKYVLKILKSSENEILGENISNVIPEIDIKNMLSGKDVTAYDEVNVNGKIHGVIVTAMKNSQTTEGVIINFKKVDNIGSRVYSRAFQSRQVTFDDILGNSKKIAEAKELAQIVSETNTNILLLGQSGTGKELFARAIHYASSRSSNPFIPVNCAAIPGDLLESELFGYEGGAFTGANKSGKPGKFELAEKGTIFLDEIGDMPFYLQAKILRVLQDRVIERVGGVTQHNIDVRIVAATNKNLEKMVSEGKFREDLYYRLNVIPINIPPLKEREGDINLLANYFLNKYVDSIHTTSKLLSPRVVEILNTYDWPGNIRELENIIQYLVALSNKDIIDIDLLPEKLLRNKEFKLESQNKGNTIGIIPIKDLEKYAILNALKFYGDSTEGKLKAAKVLGISKTTLYRKLGEYDIV